MRTLISVVLREASAYILSKYGFKRYNVKKRRSNHFKYCGMVLFLWFNEILLISIDLNCEKSKLKRRGEEAMKKLMAVVIVDIFMMGSGLTLAKGI